MPVKTDNFNRADASDLGSNWTATLADSAGITSNRAGPPPNTNDLFGDFWSADSFAADQYAQCKIRSSNSSFPGCPAGGPSVRVSGATNHTGPVGNGSGYFMYYAVFVTQLTKVVSGTETLVGTRVAGASDGDLDYIECRDNVTPGTLKLFRNGSQLGADFTDTAITSGSPGVIVEGSGGQADDWEGGDFVAAPTFVPYQPWYSLAPMFAQ